MNLHRDLFISHEDWSLEITYDNGDRQIFTAPNVKTLADIRNRVYWHADDVMSAVISRPDQTRKGRHEN